MGYAAVSFELNFMGESLDWTGPGSWDAGKILLGVTKIRQYS